VKEPQPSNVPVLLLDQVETTLTVFLSMRIYNIFCTFYEKKNIQDIGECKLLRILCRGLNNEPKACNAIST
jgi:hypothetical protein